ncbi:hypothetical protein PLEOSDRAFT_1087979 [Pleurotus ostreatus PC15]|uniref:Uncharacterized protein n=1 Tax=Pleurotus ostreatus (strain PC15) TaxID=1137138 RepID=A0A067P3W1_PLEO1|nr:hypothetical protein PLEOSDRAFT_1087979 [Pleurotus ostreatus PC15]
MKGGTLSLQRVGRCGSKRLNGDKWRIRYGLIKRYAIGWSAADFLQNTFGYLRARTCSMHFLATSRQYPRPFRLAITWPFICE